ncbi:MAG: hypothetical protein KGN84_17020, partial [Acidobacteriota bacterium]|nr:hypothetical protein [Acidobacteriota bacterium]
RAIHKADMADYRESSRPFLLLDGCGVLVSRTAGAAAIAMLTGLVQVARRLDASSPIRYMTEAEVSMLSPEVASRYQRLAGVGSAHGVSPGAAATAAFAEHAAT